MEGGEWGWLQQLNKLKESKQLKFDDNKNSSNFSKMSSVNKSTLDKLPNIFQKSQEDFTFDNLL